MLVGGKVAVGSIVGDGAKVAVAGSVGSVVGDGSRVAVAGGVVVGAMDGVSLKEIVIRALREYLKEQKK